MVFFIDIFSEFLISNEKFQPFLGCKMDIINHNILCCKVGQFNIEENLGNS